jgi:hypothetical protein
MQRAAVRWGAQGTSADPVQPQVTQQKAVA